MMDIKKQLFFCYDVVLHRKLQDKGIRYIATAISNDNKRFWLYQRTDEVQQQIKLHKQVG